MSITVVGPATCATRVSLAMVDILESMQTRRDFLKHAAMLAGGALALRFSIPDAIARALSIDPAPGTTFRDAEHVVILMQENRSFDHAFGALRGVRGFRDPRAHRQPNGNPVWFQTDARGDTYAPFRLDIADTSATWIGGLPHTWPDQVDARNGGRYDKWLIAKPKRTCRSRLATMRVRIFHFTTRWPTRSRCATRRSARRSPGRRRTDCFSGAEPFGRTRRTCRGSSTRRPTTTGRRRGARSPTASRTQASPGASIRTKLASTPDCGARRRGGSAALPTIPSNGFRNSTCGSPRVGGPICRGSSPTHPVEIAAAEHALSQTDLTDAARKAGESDLARLRTQVKAARIRARQLHRRGVECAVRGRQVDAREVHSRRTPAIRPIAPSRRLRYQDGATLREVSVPAGDVLHQFRYDVTTGALPAVSWLVAPENFSDHPSAAWYGAWYVSEVLDILTKNPDVWKKTVFILCYDENDGYFDHVPPFVAPHPARAETGKASAGIDTAVEWANVHGRETSIGLGYRVPLVIASPWSRGGCVNSQVFDHTSIIQFLEVWSAGKGKSVKETNISDWRRAVCGDLTSAFRAYDGEPVEVPASLERDATVEHIHAAKFKPAPTGGAALAPGGIAAADVRAFQESGTRPACPLPYELLVNAEAQGDIGARVRGAHRRVWRARAGRAVQCVLVWQRK